VVGGNVDDAVTMKHVPVTPDGNLAGADGTVLDTRYPWMVVLRLLWGRRYRNGCFWVAMGWCCRVCSLLEGIRTVPREGKQGPLRRHGEERTSYQLDILRRVSVSLW